MKKLYKLLLLCICMIGLMKISSKSVMASDGWGSWGDNITWTYTESTGVLKLEGSGEMADGRGAYPWDSYRKGVKKIVIGEGITSIPSWAFGSDSGGWSSDLREVQLPTTIKKIGTGAFSKNWNMSIINFPLGLTEIGDHAFWETALTEIEIPETVTIIGSSAFNSCSKLRSVKLHEGIEEMGAACLLATGIETLDLPVSINRVGRNAFQKCRNLRYACVTSSVVNGQFMYCDSLEVVKLKEGVEVIDTNGLGACDSLSAVYVPESVIDIEDGAIFSDNTITLYGYPGTVAYEYAEKTEGINFVDVSTVAGKKEWETLWLECVNRMYGDLDGNKKVELADAQIVLKSALKIINIEAIKSKSADVDANGKIELSDAQKILKYALKIISKF